MTREKDAGLVMTQRWLEWASTCARWQDLAADLVAAIDLLESRTEQPPSADSARALLARVELGQNIILLSPYDTGAEKPTNQTEGVRLRFNSLPRAMERQRDDGTAAPNASVDRAVSKAAADMISWSKDPDTFELVEQRRFKLFLAWDQGQGVEVDEYAYGLWDE